jgi:CHAD domain-containing protein
MKNAKWFSNLTAATPAPEAARIVLEARARAVSHYLRIILSKQREDPEDIHQLRVATRRLGAALTMFQDVLRRGDYKRLRRLSRSIRRTAGAVRDLDVHRELIALRVRAAPPSAAAFARTCDQALLARRRVAKRHLIERSRAAAAQFYQAIDSALERLKATPSASDNELRSLGELARETLRHRLKQLRTAGRKDLNDLDRLHELRIAAKRVRYSMEVFAGCFPAKFRSQYYRVVQRIQDDLGRVNDLRNLAATIDEISAAQKPDRRDDSQHSQTVATQRLKTRLEAERNRLQGRFVARWHADAQRQFHRHLKKLLIQPAIESRI